MRETRRRDDHKMPLLGDVPGIGKLFQQRARRRPAPWSWSCCCVRWSATDSDMDGMVKDSLARADAMAKHGEVEGNRDEVEAGDRK